MKFYLPTLKHLVIQLAKLQIYTLNLTTTFWHGNKNPITFEQECTFKKHAKMYINGDHVYTLHKEYCLILSWYFILVIAMLSVIVDYMVRYGCYGVL